MTDSMKRALDETSRRRVIQEAYNEEHGIVPQSVMRPIGEALVGIAEADYADISTDDSVPEFTTQQELDKHIAGMETEMREAAKKFEFERAAKLRDSIKELRTKEFLFS